MNRKKITIQQFIIYTEKTIKLLHNTVKRKTYAINMSAGLSVNAQFKFLKMILNPRILNFLLK